MNAPFTGWKVKKGNHEVVRRLTFQGMKVSVETDKGQERHWFDHASGERGSTKMRYPYGYFEGTKESGQSGDNMALDVYVGPVEEADEIYVVHQMKKPDFSTFDELKVMVGFQSLKQARAAYLMHYDDERFLGDMDTHSVNEFKEKYITPFINKALPGKDMGMIMSSAAGANPSRMMGQQPGAAGVDSPMPMRMPGMPMMGPGQMMSPMMMPPPIDVETIDGVNSLLGRIGNMKDPELLNVAEEIWGPGYEYINATPEHVRCEVRGFLLDQRDLLELLPRPEPVAPPPQFVNPAMPGMMMPGMAPQLGQSQSSQKLSASQPPAQSNTPSSSGSSGPSPSADSSAQAFSSSRAATSGTADLLSGPTGSRPASSSA